MKKINFPSTVLSSLETFKTFFPLHLNEIYLNVSCFVTGNIPSKTAFWDMDLQSDNSFLVSCAS